MQVTHYFTASLTAPTPAVLYAVKGDGARMAVARLMAGAEPWTVPEGVTAGISYTLPDKTPGYYDRLEDGTPACMIAGNLVSAVIAPVLTGQAGAVKVSIVLRDADGGQVATFPFQLRVEQAPGIADAEGVPAMGHGFEGKLLYGGPGGALTALALGDGVRVETTEDGTLALVAEGGSGGGGGITEEKDPTVSAWAKQPQKPTYTAQEVGALPAGTKIPGKTSELTNDAGFVNKAVNDLTNYYTRQQTQELIAAIPRFRVTVVQQLPAAGEELVLYLVPFATAEGQYLEYIWVDGRWEIIGSQRVDLTGYATEEWVQEYVEEHSGQNVNQMEPMDGDLPKVFLTGEAFSDMTAEKNEVLMGMEYISKTERFKGAIKIKWQGSSSVSNTNFLRKNFTVKLYVDDTYADKLKKTFKDWGVKENKWVLKSNWIDITASRNIVSARLWDQIVSTRADYDSLPEEIRTSPRNCEVDGFPIKLYVNGVYEGIYTWNIPKDGFMFNMDEDNPHHAVLCAEKNNDVGTLSGDAISSCEFRKAAKIDGSDWSLEFPDDLQSGIKASFNNLIDFVMTASNDDFTANLDNYLDVQSAIDYYIYAYLNCGADSLGKNLIMMTYDGVKWYASQYDMDTTWGLHFAGSKFYEPTMKCPEEYQENNSLLWQRIENCFAQRLQARYLELRKGVLSETNIINEFERFIYDIPYEIRDEEINLEAYASRPLKRTNNIQQIRSFIAARAAYVDEEFRNIVPIMPTEITLDNSSMTVALDGTAKLVATIAPEDATSKTIIWTSNNNAVATVENGVVSGISEGAAVITATTTNGLSASCAITVEAIEIPVTGLAFGQSEITVNMEDTPQYQLALAYTPPNTTQTDVVWASNNESVATVENGLVTFKAKGNVIITATSVDNPNVVATCTITVEGSNMIDIYLTSNMSWANGGNSVTTHSAFECSSFAYGIVELPTKNTEKATINCDELEVITEASKRTTAAAAIAGYDNGSTNYLSIKLPVETVALANVGALNTYLFANPIHAQFKVKKGVSEFTIPTTGWERTVMHESGHIYKFTLAVDEAILSAISGASVAWSTMGAFPSRVPTGNFKSKDSHCFYVDGTNLCMWLPCTDAELTVDDVTAYLEKFGTPKIYYVK